MPAGFSVIYCIGKRELCCHARESGHLPIYNGIPNKFEGHARESGHLLTRLELRLRFLID
jgi:hypothetical protein